MQAHEDPTLASVLAFLDTFDGDGERERRQEPREKKQKPPRGSNGGSAAKKRRTETKYTTNLQRKKRAELGELREQAALLETRLKQLQQATRSSGDSSGGEGEAGKQWVEMEEEAANELAARRRAEADNKKLREGLGRQARLREDIGRLVDKFKRQERSFDDGESLAVTTKSDACTTAGGSSTAPMTVSAPGKSTRLPSGGDMERATIPHVLEELVAQIDSVLSNSWRRSQSSWLETNEVGHAVEICMSTRTECSVIAAADILWRRPHEAKISTVIAGNEVYIPDGSHSYKRFILPRMCRPWDGHGNERSASIEVILNVEHFSRRVYDPIVGRFVLVTLALVRLPGEDEVLVREHFWKCISPIKDTDGSNSIVQTSYRIERGDGLDINPTPAQESVMHSLVQLTRRNHATYQDWLLEA